ncbi:PilW family protein [Candidatus Zixiibacteriota bacterium]
MKRRTGIQGNERGLTLIEFAMASAVAGVMFLVLYSILDQALAVYDVGLLRSRAVQNGRVVMVRIVDDLKYAEDVWVADDDRIFISRPHEQTGTAQLVDYRYNAGTDAITRRINYGTNYTFTDQIAAFTLTYRDVGFVALAMPVVDVHKIRYIEVELRLEEDNYVITLRNLVVLENPVTVP